MIPFASIIKKTAKAALKTDYLKCIATCCILIFTMLMSFVIFEILGYVSNYCIAFAVLFFVYFFVEFPLLLGIFRYFRRILYGEYDSPVSAFYYFNDTNLYKKSLDFAFSLTVKILIFAIFCYLPAILLKIAAEPEIYEWFGVSIPIWTPVLSTVATFIFVIATFVVVILSLKYYLSFFLFVSNDENSAKYAIDMSIVISKRTRLDFIYLIFSMLLYIIASVFLIPLPFTLPLLFATYTVHCVYAVYQYNDTIDNLTNSI